jgi:glycosyltransferase involved in cell wall biosynthesis
MSKSRAVLLVSPYGGEYGPPRTLEHAARAVVLAGYEPVCVVRPGAQLTKALLDAGVRTHVVARLGTVPRTMRPWRLGRFLTDHLRAAAEVARIARAERAVMVYSISEATFAGGIAARRAKLPSLVHVIGMSIRSPGWIGRPYVSLLDRLTSHFVACSSAAAEMLVAFGVREQRIDVTHNSIPIAAVDAATGVADIGRTGPSVGMIAAYDARKGHEMFVEVAAALAGRYPDVCFYIVGGVIRSHRESAAFEAAVRQRIAQLGLEDRVIQVGFVASPDVYRWIRAMDVVVVPSRTEAFAHVVLEAMACAKPVVATGIEGNLDAFVDGESGLYAAHSTESLAGAVAELLDDPQRAEEIGRAARVRAELFFDESVSLPALADTIRLVIEASGT